MKILYISLISVALLSGCASTYSAHRTKPTAEFYLVAENDSKSTTLQNVFLWAFKNTQCEANEYGTRMGSVLSNSSPANTPPHTVVANEPLVFTAVYIDARFAQNRQCAITGEFTPLPNRRYVARLAATNDVGACDLGVYEAREGKQEPLKIEMPEFVCEYGASRKLKNGRPLTTNWRVLALP